MYKSGVRIPTKGGRLERVKCASSVGQISPSGVGMVHVRFNCFPDRIRGNERGH